MYELNKKLAEWAGFTFSHTAAKASFFTGQVLGEDDFWVYPGGHCSTLPNFTQSLDACFKWLVPKLDNLRILMNVAPGGYVYWNAEAYISNTKGMTTEETPALALCLAIGKLMETP